MEAARTFKAVEVTSVKKTNLKTQDVSPNNTTVSVVCIGHFVHIKCEPYFTAANE